MRSIEQSFMLNLESDSSLLKENAGKLCLRSFKQFHIWNWIFWFWNTPETTSSSWECPRFDAQTSCSMLFFDVLHFNIQY